ncbi:MULTISPECIES: hypothetical protein [Streptomyces]|jgi:hypothetical protein|uniref:Uncharacterized protein n=1 Tax=Streptomyces thermoviolaceus subsp. thermoviolaceus TaxID=66860 RepID=A0ABX0YX81_STRTL|nr:MULTISPECIES: hypothetical protein [Streptomyces]MCM3265743.1 hypothetical protein [Streptomyces thermoviolaceus]NJP17216.1 hypothetical protein [Streptomyces thermoviolaceus subsp. thermoviolaceus]RSR95813.1 hypothetical protein EF917_24735 [Streptomyces sp. WAC00469]WTD49159.1 hypothetical protein OG899_17555 [Streptomyces thermoviolaceus]GGV73361.1 hypothetical protein GCM10010499_26750 [Streptomyces thermoviolaceus subsp. apingens]
MTDEGTHLGPLAPVGSGWGFGNATRPGSHWVELRPDGLCHHQPDDEDLLIPWHRIMTYMTGIGIDWNGFGRWSSHQTLPVTLRPKAVHRPGGWLVMTVRHPYEDVRLRFDRHPRQYGLVDAARLEELLGQLSERDRLSLLGDPDWLGRVVTRLTAGDPRPSYRVLCKEVTEAIEAADAAR